MILEHLIKAAMVREIYLDNEIFSRSGKSQGILWMAREILERTWKVREKLEDLKINGYGKQTSENLFFSVQEGKRCTFS